MDWNRRDALKSGLAISASLGLNLAVPLSALADGPTLIKATGYPYEATRKAVELLGGMSKFVGRGSSVVIKPNMGFAHPPNIASTTNPEVIRALAEMALDAGAKRVLILDNPVHNPKTCLEQNGIRQAVKDLSIAVVAPREAKFFTELPVPEGRQLRKTDVYTDIIEADTFINVPTAKCHGGSTVSLGMKNLMGAVRDRRPFHTIHDLHQSIADLASLVRPHLTVLDASRCLLTNGPGGPGKMLLTKTIIAGTDPVAVDAMGVTLAPWYERQFAPEDIGHIVIASKMGLGEIDSARWKVLTAVA